jgi:hypothetical protein
MSLLTKCFGDFVYSNVHVITRTVHKLESKVCSVVVSEIEARCKQNYFLVERSLATITRFSSLLSSDRNKLEIRYDLYDIMVTYSLMMSPSEE